MRTDVLDGALQPEDRLPEDRLPEDRLPEDRLPEDRLPDDLDLFDRLAATGDIPPIDDSLAASSGRTAPVEGR